MILQKCFPVKRLWRNLSQDFRISNWLILPLAIIRMYRKAGAESVIGAAGSHVAGAAGESTSRLEDLGVGGLYMADGPAGLRLATSYKIVDGEIKGNANALLTLWNLWARKNSR